MNSIISLLLLDKSKVRNLRVVKDNSIVNRLNKTKEEKFPQLDELQQEREVEIRAVSKEQRRTLVNLEKTQKRGNNY